MNVPFLDVGATYRELQGEIDDAVGGVLRSGWYLRGAALGAFEADWATFCGARYAVGLGNGLDAIRLILGSLGIGAGDEVVVPAHTFVATALAVTQVGATPVFADADPVTRNLDPAAVERALSPRTKAVLPVHLYGRPADLDALGDLAKERGLRLVEDAAQAHGATWRGRPIGAHGNPCSWSFYPGKNLGAFGDAGGVTTDDEAFAARIRAFGNYGSSRKYHHEFQGINSRLDELQAAVLRVKLTRLAAWNERRRAIARRYLAELRDVPDLALPPADDERATSSWHLFVVEHPRRDALQAALAARGVDCQVHYPIACHRQQAYAQAVRMPVAERLAATVLSLPLGPHLAEAQVDRVIEAVRDAAGELARC